MLAVQASEFVIVYAVVDDSLSPTSPLGDAVGVCNRKDADRFIEDVRGDYPELASPGGSRSAGSSSVRRTSEQQSDMPACTSSRSATPS